MRWNVANEPRISKGRSGGGRWTAGGEPAAADAQRQEHLARMRRLSGGPSSAALTDAVLDYLDFDNRSKPGSAEQAVDGKIAAGDERAIKKDRFVRQHLADAQTVSRESGIPVSYILGAAAKESGWGGGRFVFDKDTKLRGENYFALHAPAEFQRAQQKSRGDDDMAVFDSFLTSARSFAKHLKKHDVTEFTSDPLTFADAMQAKGKFGYYKNEPVLGYPKTVASIINGLAPFVEHAGK